MNVGIRWSIKKNFMFFVSVKSRVTPKKQDASDWLKAQGDLFTQNWIEPVTSKRSNPIETGSKSDLIQRPDLIRFSADAHEKSWFEKSLNEKSLNEKSLNEKRGTEQDEEDWIFEKKNREDDLRDSNLKYFREKQTTTSRTPFQ